MARRPARKQDTQELPLETNQVIKKRRGLSKTKAIELPLIMLWSVQDMYEGSELTLEQQLESLVYAGLELMAKEKGEQENGVSQENEQPEKS